MVCSEYEIEAVLPALEKLEHIEIIKGIMTIAPIDAGEEDLKKYSKRPTN